MNCQEMNHLIDAHAPEALTLAQREAIDQHLGDCRDCREDMAAFREVAALQVPAMSVKLRGRIATALPVQQVAVARRVFRPYVIGGVLLAGAALAAAIKLQLAGRGPQSPARVATQPGLVAPEATPATDIQLPELPVNAAAAAAPVATAAGNAEATAAVAKPLDPHRMLVVKVAEAAAGVSDIALMERCHDGIVRELRNLGGVDVVMGTAPYRATSIEDQVRLPGRLQKDARGIGAGKVLTVSTSMGCDAILFSSDTGNTVQGAGGGGVDPQGGRVEAFAKGMAASVRTKTLFDAGAEIAAARAVLLDTALPDRQRAAALWVPIQLDPAYTTSMFRSFYDSAVLAAAASIGVKSKDADARQAVWAVLRKINDPALVQPLLQVLANDDDASVRYQAALSLNTFLAQPGVREALLHAAAEDPQRESEVPCCMLTVREAAQRASVANKDFREWVRQALLDESLPTRSRLLSLQNSSPDGRFTAISVADFGKDAARVVFDIGQQQQDPQLRAMAWNSLWRAAPDESFLPVLISDLASHPSELVRAPAARVLAGQVANRDVRAALERALNDSSVDVRRYASEALAEGGK